MPIIISWDKSTKVRLVVTRTLVRDRDISKGIKDPIPVELVEYDLEIPYPLARQIMQMATELISSSREGAKLYNPKGLCCLTLKQVSYTNSEGTHERL